MSLRVPEIHISNIFVYMPIMSVTIIYVRLYVSMAAASWFDIVGLNQIHQNIAKQKNFINAHL